MDASTAGMGGIWLDALKRLPPLLWQQRFPKEVTDAVVSWDNPKGELTNSDLEQAGMVCHPDILAQQYDVWELSLIHISEPTRPY